jgi:uncharacterized protein
MFIDIHVHAYRYRGCQRNWGGDRMPTPKEVLAIYDKLDIEKGVLLPLVSPEGRHQLNTMETILETCKEFPDRFIPFLNIDPRQVSNSADSALIGILAYYQELGCKGIGEITANLAFNDPKVENLFKYLEILELPMIFHVANAFENTYGLYDEPGLPLLEAALQKFPKLTFLGHSQAFWAEIGELNDPSERGKYPKGPIPEPGRVVELMRKYSNLHGDLSAGSGFNAMSRDKEFGLKFMEEFQDRLYFGTDITKPNGPTPLLEYLLELQKNQEIGDKTFHKIARENAVRLLDL